MNSFALEEITSTIETYLDGLFEGDVVKLRQSFNSVCYLHSVVDGKVSALSLDDWCKLIENRPSPKSQNFERSFERILSLQQIAPNCAVAIVNCAVPGRRFTDHLSLVKTESRWEIVNKLFHAEIVE